MLHNDNECSKEICEWIEAAKVVHIMRYESPRLYGTLLQRYA